MKRNLRFILILLKMKLSKMMMYRFSFFGGTLIDGTLFLLWLLMFNAIYSQVDSIGGWSRGQSIIFLGTFSLLNAINMTIYFFGIIAIPNKIRSGELDHYLTKPINPLLRISFENINLGSAPLILFSVVIIIYGISLQGIVIDVITVVFYTLFIILMAILYYDMELIIRTIPFFVISANSIERIENAALDLCMRVPGVLFKGGFKLLFYFILPYGLMATIPTQVITSTISGMMTVTSMIVVALFTIFAQWFWWFGLKNYKSASS